MRKFTCFVFLGLMTIMVGAQPKAYTLFDEKGNAVEYEKMIGELAQADVVFFGEMHNDPICHWMETQVLKSLYGNWNGKINVGMEMFEADNQLIIDEYFSDVIGAKQFESECRFWPNYSTDYAPIVDFCKENNIRLIASNVPRRYANVVKNRGLAYLDSLSTEAKCYLPALPIPYEENEQAQGAFSMMSMMGGGRTNPALMGQAQGVKDATMAWFISKNLDKKVLHYNGNYHSDANDGIIKYLKKYVPGVKVKTIYSVKQEDVDKLDDTYLGHGDFYLCVPEDMVTTY
ncbi:MAG: ChaN family lipoprotein [Bacteroidaceae bacterium]|nr:ChaN family lipoprotein [Bacteroidaceae bacterium]